MSLLFKIISEICNVVKVETKVDPGKINSKSS